MTVDEATSAFSALAANEQIRFLASFGHNLTIVARDTYEFQASGVTAPERLRAINEIQHRVLSQIYSLLAGSEWAGSNPTEVICMSTENQTVIPMISYEDGIAALEWLAKAFGFREVARICDPTGRLMHGELAIGDGLVMLASPTADYEGPKRHRESCESARKWSSVPWIVDGVLVQVDDLDGHFEHATASGATILSEIEDGPPGRRYRAEDPEGHRWLFLERDRAIA